MNPLKNLALKFSTKAREKRARIFRKHFSFTEHTKILDLGSENGKNIYNIIQGTAITPKNVYIADIDSDLIAEGEKAFGFNGIVVEENKSLPFEDGFFDIVYCSSVIEHTTIPKSEVWDWKNTTEFKTAAWIRQTEFANEIERLSKQYFVQTPSKTFPVESHTWLPILGYLPREMFLPILKVSNKFWIKKTDPDFNLLGENEMRRLFPDSQILKEVKFGMTKSFMAVKSETNKF